MNFKIIIIVLIFIIGVIFDFIYIRKNIAKIREIKPFKIGLRKLNGSIVSEILYTSVYYGLIVPPFFELLLDKIYVLVILIFLSLIFLFYFVETIRYVIFRLSK